MKDSRLIDFLKTFSAEEFKEFEKFAASPYYNKGRDLTKFLNVLKKFYPDFTGKGIEKESIFKKLFPGEKYNDQTMRTLSSKLAKVSEEFLLTKNVNRDPQKAKIYLIDEMQFRGLNKYTEKMLNQLGTDIKKEETSYDMEYYLKQFLFSEVSSQQFYKNDNQDAKKQHYPQDAAINFFLQNLIYYLNIEFVDRFNKNIHNTATLVSIFSECLLGKRKFEDVIDFMRNNNSGDSIPAEIFLSYSKLVLSEPGLADYLRMKEIIIKNMDKLSHPAKYSILTHLQNAGAILGRSENLPSDHIEYMFEICSLMFKHKLFTASPGNPMRSVFFSTSILTAFSVNKTDWMEMFIKTGTPFLLKNNQDKMRNFGMAHLSFLKKDFTSANEYISRINEVNFEFKSELKILQLMIYFEQGYYEEALSMLDSFRHFLVNHKNMSQVRRDNQLNFAGFYSRILKCKASASKKDAENILIELETKKEPLRNITWLSEKAKELSFAE